MRELAIAMKREGAVGPAGWSGMRGAAILAAFAAVIGHAEAQVPVCEQIRAELASLSQVRVGSTPSNSAEARRLRNELENIRLSLQRGDCNRGGFFIFNQPPATCAPLQAQARQLEARLAALDQGTVSNAVAQRRGQLMAALERYQCNTAQALRPPGTLSGAAQQEPGFFERLFQPRPAAVDPNRTIETLPLTEDELADPRGGLGGRMAVCVRTCDGFFFPVNFERMSARDDFEQICRSLCPAAQTRVFFKTTGGDIDRAAARDGTPYMSQPYATRYRTSRDPTCVCKNPNQTWAQATFGTEDLLETRKGDILVTPEKALALSRPKDVAPTPSGAKPPPKPAPAADSAEESVPESALPTGGSASSGIGQGRAGPDVVLGLGEGQKIEIAGSDGTSRTVRVIVPGLVAQ